MKQGIIFIVAVFLALTCLSNAFAGGFDNPLLINHNAIPQNAQQQTISLERKGNLYFR